MPLLSKQDFNDKEVNFMFNVYRYMYINEQKGKIVGNISPV